MKLHPPIKRCLRETFLSYLEFLEIVVSNADSFELFHQQNRSDKGEYYLSEVCGIIDSFGNEFLKMNADSIQNILDLQAKYLRKEIYEEYIEGYNHKLEEINSRIRELRIISSSNSGMMNDTRFIPKVKSLLDVVFKEDPVNLEQRMRKKSCHLFKPRRNSRSSDRQETTSTLKPERKNSSRGQVKAPRVKEIRNPFRTRDRSRSKENIAPTLTTSQFQIQKYELQWSGELNPEDKIKLICPISMDPPSLLYTLQNEIGLYMMTLKTTQAIRRTGRFDFLIYNQQFKYCAAFNSSKGLVYKVKANGALLVVYDEGRNEGVPIISFCSAGKQMIVAQSHPTLQTLVSVLKGVEDERPIIMWRISVPVNSFSKIWWFCDRSVIIDNNGIQMILQLNVNGSYKLIRSDSVNNPPNDKESILQKSKYFQNYSLLKCFEGTIWTICHLNRVRVFKEALSNPYIPI